ncbi:unnamed protein product [Sympodiomycopsis kandeliae]
MTIASQSPIVITIPTFSNKMDDDEGAGEIPPLQVSGLQLTHDHPSLNSNSNNHPFDPSDLLCSLLPTPISSIATQLASFDRVLSDDLQAVVDSEHKEFLALATRLGGETHRIDRLAHWAHTGPSNASSGLEGLRRHVEQERDNVQQIQAHLGQLVNASIATDQRAANLNLLLAFSDALLRLESLLGIQSSTSTHPHKHANGQGGNDDGDDDNNDDEQDDQDADIVFGSSADHSDSDSDSDSIFSDDSSNTSPSHSTSSNHPHSSSSSNRKHLTKASPVSHSHSHSHVTTRPASADLPAKIFRAKSAWEALGFLTKAAQQPHSPTMPFFAAHQQRLQSAKQAIIHDCSQLLLALLQPDSLLLQQPSSATTANAATGTSTLQSWSQVEYSTEEHLRPKQLQEQKTWLLLVLDTWFQAESDDEHASQAIKDIIRTQTIQGWVSSKNTADGRRTSPTLAHVFDVILAYTTTLTNLLSVLEHFDLRRHSAAQLHTFQTILWPDIVHALTQQLGDQLFYVGARLEDFRSNYLATLAFLDAFAALAPSDASKRAWRSSPSYASFLKRWQLSVYFQMRYRSIAGQLETSLQQQQQQPTSSTGKTLPLMAATEQALHAYARPWDSQGHIDALAPRQWKLSLLVIARYYEWLKSQLPSSRGSSGIAGDQSAPDGEVQAAEDKELHFMTVLVADAMWFHAWLVTTLQDSIAPILLDNQHSSADELLNDMKNAAAQTFPFEQDILPLLTDRIVTLLKARSAEPLRLVRSVNTSSSYRSSANNTTATTSDSLPEPSYFIPHILRPLKHLFGIASSKGIADTVTPARLVPSSIKLQWATDVIEDVATRYAASLTQMIQNYESLRRLKRGGGPSASGSGSGFSGFATSWLGKTGASSSSSGSNTSANQATTSQDPEGKRMQLQMKADVQRLEHEIHDLKEIDIDIDLSALDSWQKLKDVIEGRTRD